MMREYPSSGLSVNLVDSATDTAVLLRPQRNMQTVGAGVNIVTSATGTSADTDTLPRAVFDNWGRFQHARFTEDMQSRLILIARILRRPNAKPLRSQSLSDFLEFWNQVRAAAVEPEVTVAADGTLVAEWFRSAQQRLDVRFVSGRAVFGLFSKREIIEGTRKLTEVAKMLKTHSARPLQWSA